ncbi:MAG TPA: ComEC/Rec2 family competence protein, partial [Lachnospiraceae bacterium]|nr:ComEC/Rec2 family competence protein [Lachnospiraceae bacterium]
MIKRPLIWIAVSFVIGILSVNLESMYSCILFICILLILIILYLTKRSSKSILLHSEDRFLLLLPIVIVIGYLLMNNQCQPEPLDSYFEEVLDTVVQGEVDQIAEKDGNYTLYLKNVSILIPVSNPSQTILTSLKSPNHSNQNIFFSPRKTTQIPANSLSNPALIPASSSSNSKQNSVNIEQSNEGKSYKCSKIIIYTSASIDCKIGNVIKASGTLQKFAKPTNYGQFDAFQYYRSQGISYKCKVDSYKVIDYRYSKYRMFLMDIRRKLVKVYDEILPEKESSTMKAMLLGEKNTLDLNIKELYQKSGISHILAISGLHISLIG